MEIEEIPEYEYKVGLSNKLKKFKVWLSGARKRYMETKEKFAYYKRQTEEVGSIIFGGPDYRPVRAMRGRRRRKAKKKKKVYDMFNDGWGWEHW